MSDPKTPAPQVKPPETKPEPRLKLDPEVTPEPGAAYDPFSYPILYLRSKGWQPLGDPRHMHCTWEDPLRSLKETYDKVPILAQHFDGYDDLKRPIYNVKQVHVKNKNGQSVPAVQTRFTPAGREYSRNEALRIQIERDQTEMKANRQELQKVG